VGVVEYEGRIKGGLRLWMGVGVGLRDCVGVELGVG